MLMYENTSPVNHHHHHQQEGKDYSNQQDILNQNDSFSISTFSRKTSTFSSATASITHIGNPRPNFVREFFGRLRS
jgi:hypothetical protein